MRTTDSEKSINGAPYIRIKIMKILHNFCIDMKLENINSNDSVNTDSSETISLK